MNEQPPAARAVVYEFHIAGTVGPLARAALPELTAATAHRFTVLTGTVDSRGDLHRLLHALDTHGTPATDVHVTRRDPATDSSPTRPLGVT